MPIVRGTNIKEEIFISSNKVLLNFSISELFFISAGINATVSGTKREITVLKIGVASVV